MRAELNVGQKVICKHKNGRYYQCEVVQLTQETFYEVNFDDGSFSDNLFPEDIVVRGLKTFLCHVAFRSHLRTFCVFFPILPTFRVMFYSFPFC